MSSRLRVTPTADKEETSSISSTPSDSPAFARRLGPEMLPLMLTAGQSSADQTPQLSGRAVAVGLAVGTVLCFTNMYFGLQTGWVTMGSIQSAVVGFAVFRFCWPRGGTPFGPHENVVVQSIAVATATMPLAGGFVGIVPALQMLSPPVRLSVAQQLAWCGGLTYFGIFFAVPLRRQTILVEQLRFPSGTATAKLIDTLHARREGGGRWRVLGWSFGASYCLSLLAYFAPAFANLRPFDWLCLPAASAWHWTVRPSLSYVGQGMIMGQRSALSMLAGALTAWAVLGPMAVSRGWVAATARPAGTPPAAAEAAEGGCAAPPLPEGAINSWEVGAQGWLLWVAMGLMVSEALSSLAVLTARQFLMLPPPSASAAQSGAPGGGEGEAEEGGGGGGGGGAGGGGGGAAAEDGGGDPLEVAPPSQLVPARWWLGGLGASALLCVAIVAPLFSIPAWQLLVSICLSCLLAVLGVRALGQTDLEPVSALGKLSQIAFAVLAPGHLVTNLVAGAIAEAGAMQAGDLMQDLKAGHLLGASPRAQFYAQLIGSSASVLVTVAAFNMYTSAYGCAGEAGWECEQFQAPVAHVWKDMAVLMQQGVAALPPSALAFAKAFALLGVALPLAEAAAGESALGRLLPSGIAFGIGMYVKPDWTLPRVAGSVLEWAWRRRSPRSHERHMLMAASGFVLGEGIASMVTLALKSLRG